MWSSNTLMLNLEVSRSFKDSIKNINGLLPLNIGVIKETLLYIYWEKKVLELVCLFKSMELLLTGLATINVLLSIWLLTIQLMISLLAGLPKTNACMDIVRWWNFLSRKKGIPLAIYSDKHTIFKSPEGNITSFGVMMDKLCIEMIFANTSQTKGLIERYNGTVQRRLPNDIIRFKIKDYDQLNIWFNTFT